MRYERKYTTNGGAIGHYKPDHPERAYRLCLLGLTDQQLALAFGIHIATLNDWKSRHEEFIQALIKGRKEADSNVAYSLYHRAIGYSHPDTHITTGREEVYNDQGKKIKSVTSIIQTPIIRHYPPDTGAAIFWLKNRQAELWKDVQRQEHVLKRLEAVELEDLSDDELQLMLRVGLGGKELEQKINQN